MTANEQAINFDNDQLLGRIVEVLQTEDDPSAHHWLRAIELENFKSFKEPTRIEFAALTLFFGPNSAGKSSIADALQFFLVAIEGDLTSEEIERCTYKNDLSKPIRLRVEFNQLSWNGHISHVEEGDTENSVAMFLAKHFEEGSYFNEYGNPGRDIEANVALEVVVDPWARISLSSYIGDICVVKIEHVPDPLNPPDGKSPDDKMRRVSVNLYNPVFIKKSDRLKIKKEPQERFPQGKLVAKDILENFYRNIGLEYLEEFEHYQGVEVDDGGIWVCFGELPGEDGEWWLLGFISHGSKSLSLLHRNESLFDNFSSRSDGQSNDDYWLFELGFNQSCVFLAHSLRRALKGLSKRIGPLRSRLKPMQAIGYDWLLGEGAWRKVVEPGLSSSEPMESVNQWLQKSGFSYKLIGAKRISALIPDEKCIEEKGSISFDISDAQSFVSGRRPILYDVNAEMLVGLHEVGTGVSQVAPVIIAALTNTHDAFFVEQPELHLHPKAQVQLGDLFLSAVQRIHGGFVPTIGSWVVETHSEHLLLRVLRRIRENNQGIKNVDFSADKENVAVYYFSRTGSESTATRLPITQEGDFTVDWPEGFFDERDQELFF